MQCPRCQHENEADAKFCEECAALLPRMCPNCGRQLSATAKFCPACAHEDELRRALAHLQAAEFLRGAALPRPRTHVQTRAPPEVAYASLLHERRRTLHARLVEAIERLYPDRLPEQVENVAHHAFRGEVWDKALAYLRQAGARALARSPPGGRRVLRAGRRRRGAPAS
jgi:hypothetical protein